MSVSTLSLSLSSQADFVITEHPYLLYIPLKINSDSESTCSSCSKAVSEEQEPSKNSPLPAIDASSESSSIDDDDKYVFGISPMFSDCEQSITEDTVFKVKFKIHNINRKHNLFEQEITRRCRESKLKGYIYFKNNQTAASGIMVGGIKDINRVKDWVQQAKDLIEEPLKTNVFFTWFLIATKPFEFEFGIQKKPPDYTDSVASK